MKLNLCQSLISTNYKKAVRGFTLIEILIVVAIVAILASIAYPSYESHMRKTFRGTAKSCLLEHASSLERSYSTSMSYPAIPVLGCRTGNNLNNRYTIGGTSGGTAFNLTATPIGPQTADTQCGTLSVTQTGQRNATGTLGTAGCW